MPIFAFREILVLLAGFLYDLFMGRGGEEEIEELLAQDELQRPMQHNRGQEYLEEFPGGVRLHREGAPARVYADGSEEYWRHGVLDNPDGPAIVLSDGYTEYRRRGMRHNPDGPAIIYPDGSVEYWLFDQLHNPDDVCRILPDGTKERRLNGMLHSPNHPALERTQEVAEREGVPLEEWLLEDKLHREGAPARIWADGREEHWLHGRRQPQPEEKIEPDLDEEITEDSEDKELSPAGVTRTREPAQSRKQEPEQDPDPETALENEILRQHGF